MKSKAFLLTVTGRDKPGIIAGVTGILFKRGCNLEDVTMTILEGELAMIQVVCFKSERDYELVCRDFEKLKKSSGLSTFWRPLTGSLKRGEKHGAGTVSYLVSAVGKDRTGIVHAVSRLLAQKKLNITDLNSRILGTGKQAVYAMMLEVDIPRAFPAARLESELGRLGKKLGIEIKLKPVERLDF